MSVQIAKLNLRFYLTAIGVSLLCACGAPQTQPASDSSRGAWAAVERSATASADTPVGAGATGVNGERPPCPRAPDMTMARRDGNRAGRGRGSMGGGGMGRGGMGRGGMGRGGMGRGGMGRGGMGRGGMGRGGMGRGGMGRGGPPDPMIARYDQNGDGTLDRSERAAMRRQQAGELFVRTDDNRDGRLSHSELNHACGRLGQRLQHRFTDADRDSDGFLSRHEVESFDPPEGR